MAYALVEVVNGVPTVTSNCDHIPTDLKDLDWREYTTVYDVAIDHAWQQWSAPNFDINQDGSVYAFYFPEDQPIDSLKAYLKSNVESTKNNLFQQGYPHDFGGAVGVKYLQTRNDTDRTNWSGVAQAAKYYIDAGQGAATMNPIRTSDNTMVPLNANDSFALMLSLQSYLGQIYTNAWNLKDAIESATTVNDLKAINLNSGWPV